MLFSAEDFRALVSGERQGLRARLLRGGLALASIPYGWGTALRNALYDRGWKRSHRAAVPVVSVGNLTLGGTGKTPCVEYVASYYRTLDRRVAILSRGYGSPGGRNDEALLLEENLPDVPHLQGADRVALTGIAVTELESEVLVLDDAFQHRRLARDLDIVLVDATGPWGQGWLFPRGFLREARRGLRRAGVVVLTRCDQVAAARLAQLRQEIVALAPKMPIAESVHRPIELVNEGRTLPLEHLAERRVAAFCGIGNPDAFRRTLYDTGAVVGDFRTFPDHHAYTREDVDRLREWARQLATDCMVLTTQKDLVKLRLARLDGHEVWAVRICLAFTAGQATLDRKLKEALG